MDKATGIVTERKPEEIFMIRDLYRDTINNPDNPVQIENDLARFECEVARTIKKLHLEGDIIISCDEEESSMQ